MSQLPCSALAARKNGKWMAYSALKHRHMQQWKESSTKVQNMYVQQEGV